ncbi:MAG: proline--tRNA ligase [Oligoflexales bacterium]
MTDNANKTAVTPRRSEDYPEWYQQVTKAGELAENSDVRGCMVIKPWGYAIWEKMQAALDKMFKETGHVNAYFPLFIPLSHLQKEADHVEGFATECAVVTHHRLEKNAEGTLVPAGPLDEPLIVRPTSEVIIGSTYAKWVQSYRDLPILINQWANVVRWEMRTRMFLRTTEFLWQEGHTVHATDQEAMEETLRMLDVYETFCQDYMAMPVVKGEKPAHERFPGAVNTYSIEAMMQDKKALQSGTSHFLGQNFSKAMGIRFQDQNSTDQLAWTTSWGVSTRLIGGLIMTHGDDNGIILPPRLAPKHVVIMPIIRSDKDQESVLKYCNKVKKELSEQKLYNEPIEVLLDDRDIRGGDKAWQHIKKGVPLRMEIGPKDIEAGKICVMRRDQDPKQKEFVNRDQCIRETPYWLHEIQKGLYNRASAFRKQNTHEIKSLKDFRDFFTPKNEQKPEIHGGFAVSYWSDDPSVLDLLKQLKVTMRVIPFSDPDEGTCIFTGRKGKKAIFAKAY